MYKMKYSTVTRKLKIEVIKMTKIEVDRVISRLYYIIFGVSIDWDLGIREMFL